VASYNARCEDAAREKGKALIIRPHKVDPVDDHRRSQDTARFLAASGLAVEFLIRDAAGEVGNVDTASLIDLPMPFIIGPSVWMRPYHFASAWLLVLSGFAYVIGGFITGHLSKDLIPAPTDLHWHRIGGVISGHLHWRRPSVDEAWTYNVVQRLTYLFVVFILFPAIIWTGLGMSFGATSVFPFLATALGGHQSARTLHFICVGLLVLFAIVHIVMLCLVGFRSHVRAMITGYIPQRRSAQ
jgi:thiosulfate reductase cytochrome b subunit